MKKGCLGCLVGLLGVAQISEAAGGGRYGFTPIAQLSETSRFQTTLEYRYEGRDITLFRPEYHKDLSDHFGLDVGYDYFSSTHSESRLWQQFQGHINLDTSQISSRLRLEERSLATSTIMGFRLRWQVAYTYSFGENGSPALLASNEYFVQFRDFDGSGVVKADRNWFSLAVRIPMGSDFAWTVGGLEEHVFGKNVSVKDRWMMLAGLGMKI